MHPSFKVGSQDQRSVFDGRSLSQRGSYSRCGVLLAQAERRLLCVTNERARNL